MVCKLSVALARWSAFIGTPVLLLAGVPAAAFAHRVTLNWDRNAAPDVAGYRLRYGTSSRNYTQIKDVGNTTTATLSNLTARQKYFLVVTTYNRAAVESPPSKELSFIVPPDLPS